MKNILALTASALLLAGCNDPNSAWNRPAGSISNTGDFGAATMQNTQVMSGDQSFTIQLGQRFASEVNTTVNFAFNSSVLDGEAQAILRQQADWIRQFPELKFKVFGHTDLVGSNASNYRLGLRRAQAVVAYLATQGVSTSRLQALVSYGETRPVIQTPNMERANRRTVTEVSGFVAGGRQGGTLNGKYAEVIFREYIASATPTPQISQTTGADLQVAN